MVPNKNRNWADPIVENTNTVNTPSASQSMETQISQNSLPLSVPSNQRQDPNEEITESVLMGVNTDEDIAFLEKVLELQSLDQEFNL